MIDGRTTRHAGHAVSMRIRKRIEERFGWIKTIGGGRKLRYIGRQRNRALFKIIADGLQPIRITALDTTPPDTPSTGLRRRSPARPVASRPPASVTASRRTHGLRQDQLFQHPVK